MNKKRDFKTYLKQTASEIENELHSFANDWNRQIEEFVPEIADHNNQFTRSFFGGKMIRGTLVKLGYEIFGTKPTPAIVKPAAAYEILHTALMIHDDIIDESPMRRGRPALHIAKDKHHGISQALCLGDLGLTLAVKLILESDFPLEVRNTALRFFLQTEIDTVLGEMLDVESAKLAEPSEKQVLAIHKMKTARYTFVGPLVLGALLAGKNKLVLEKIKQFGEPLGIAFQIQDDILGVFGTEQTIGKSITSDIEENKATLLLSYSMKHGTKKQKEILERNYGKKGIIAIQADAVRLVFLQTGALEHSQKEIEKLITQAKKAIPTLTKDENKQRLLTELADLVLERKK